MPENERYDNDNQNNNIFMFIIICCFTACNVLFFFYIKNTTHEIRNNLKQTQYDYIEEERKMTIMKINFNKKYSTQKLQELSKEFNLNLQFSNIKQIQDWQDVLINR